MKILFLGDVVGKVGRRIINERLASLKKEHQIDLTIINGENAAHGKGITSRIYHGFINLGVDVVTLGNHAFSKGEILTTFDDCENLIRPMNLKPLEIGKAVIIKEINNLKVAICNINGVVFMNNIEGTPYDAMDQIIKNNPADIYFVDFHAEATAEKLTFWNYYRDKVQVVVGTHTHVQTADEQIYNGSAYISDVGMCGAYDSILGRDTNEVISRMVHNNYTRYLPAEGSAVLSGVVIEIDEKTKKAVKITRIQERPEL